MSSDQDWQRFCARFKRLFWTADLGDALGAFQDETARFAARRLVKLSTAGGPLDLATVLLEALHASAGAIKVQVEAQCFVGFGWKEAIDVQRRLLRCSTVRSKNPDMARREYVCRCVGNLLTSRMT
ncbi:hypothetical protein BamIOP4010DRAFT_3351 [Burkholderia ambifaria IOP40-10]|uniref:Uncharacterized protein n=1 Tax=Burkholderia ambifaria IOP40-10 TaxID=396596 RepID=B1FH41_9BURK|nr:hypothetical protein [Burkholderia ambifaria]EDT03125.1 hypothetical protein BamIOP4010DRAFT_3351 [Burkholderia ambifaria IOP40-10]